MQCKTTFYNISFECFKYVVFFTNYLRKRVYFAFHYLSADHGLLKNHYCTLLLNVNDIYCYQTIMNRENDNINFGNCITT